MKYKDLALLYEKLEATSKRLEKTFLVADFISKCNEKEIGDVVLLLQGRAFPEWDPREIGVASKLVIRALSRVTGIKVAEIEALWARLGDLGKVAEQLSSKKKQQTLFAKSLSVSYVVDTLKKISVLEGEGTIDKKLAYISDLLINAYPIEAKYIVRTILAELRVGIAGGILRDAITWAFAPLPEGIFYRCGNCNKVVPATEKCVNCGSILHNKEEAKHLSLDQVLNYGPIASMMLFSTPTPRDDYNKIVEYVEDAYNILNDYSELAHILKTQGLKALKNIELTPYRPIRVMLAQKAETIEEGIKKMGLPCAVEYKYDGFRMQIHKEKGKKAVIYTRRLENVTPQFPEVVDAVEKIHADSFIIDCECVAIDPTTKKFYPFQRISQRIKRKYNIAEMMKEIPVELHVFDIVYYNGKTILKLPFEKRRKIIEEIIPEDNIVKLAVQKIVHDAREIEQFYEESLSKGNEGIMFKSLDAPYKPGSRVGYMMKLKPTAETFDLVITRAEWGEGKRSKWLSSFYVACIDPVTGNFLEVGKASTGLKEKSEEGLSYEDLTNLLKPLIIEEKGKEVVVRPSIVVEVGYQEIQKSPTYESGLALRFPRIVRLREERSPRDITTINEIEKAYKEQQGKK